MYKIGIVGHSPENISMPEDKVKRTIRQTIDLLNYQYNTDVIFNVMGEIGVGLWAAEECIDLPNDHDGTPFRYHIFLPYPQEMTAEYWYDDQKELLRKCCNNAYSITTCEFQRGLSGHSYQDLVFDSNFLICFWTGKKQGKTFETIRFALQNNKIVLNGLHELKLITNKNISK